MPNRTPHAFFLKSDISDGTLYEATWLDFCAHLGKNPRKLAEKYADLRPYAFEPTPNRTYLHLVDNKDFQLLIDPVVLEYLKPLTVNNNRFIIRARDCQFYNKSKMYRLPRTASQPEFGRFIYIHHVWPFYQMDPNWALLFGLNPEELPSGLPRRSLVETLELYREALRPPNP